MPRISTASCRVFHCSRKSLWSNDLLCSFCALIMYWLRVLTNFLHYCSFFALLILLFLFSPEETQLPLAEDVWWTSRNTSVIIYYQNTKLNFLLEFWWCLWFLEYRSPHVLSHMNQSQSAFSTPLGFLPLFKDVIKELENSKFEGMALFWSD